LRHGCCALLAIRKTFTHNSQINASGGIAMAVRSRKFRFGVMLGTLLSASVWAAASQAYTPEQEQACRGDAFRLCSAEIPDVERITMCMARNRSQLSPACRAYIRPAPEVAASPGSGKPRRARGSDDD
jgi:hypothetical protein